MITDERWRFGQVERHTIPNQFDWIGGGGEDDGGGGEVLPHPLERLHT